MFFERNVICKRKIHLRMYRHPKWEFYMASTVNPLPAPDLPQMTPDNSISLDDINVAGGVFVRIKQYEDAARSDYITVLWGNEPVKKFSWMIYHLISPLLWSLPAIWGEERITLMYISEDVAGNIGTSIGFNVNIIDGAPDIIYLAPVFTDAVNGIIDQNSIKVSAGTHVHVAPYTGIMANDTVTLFWRGKNASGAIVDSGVDSQIILAADISTGATFLIPENKLESLKDKGTVTASYQVRRNGAVMGGSEYSKATLDLSGSTGLSMIISTGAANTDYDAIHFHPYNQGVVKRPAGATVILSAVGDAVFDESGAGTYQPVLNESGESSFKLRSAVQSNSEISAEAMSNPGASVSQNVRFGAFTKGNGDIQYLNYSTGAPANGVTPCSVYLKTAPSSGLRAEITRVRVTVSGSAVNDGYSS